ncbi:MAG: MBL fold metallo-hydrolase [Phycisphaeraceae bacterium]|nr:MBL fold metallo-hydrolase [Phycisphaeraceae bacterium]MCB9848353.1 MBL fold metallo-hydrolase [Phycisphaeraceae bacterium]
MPDSAQTPIVERFVLGPFETNCYVVSAPGSDSCWIVDAGYGPDAMIERIRERGQRVGAVVLTHAHADHIAGLDEIIGAFPGVPVFLHPSERAWLRDPELNLSGFAGTPLVCDAEATGELSDGQALELLGATWRVLHTPGHSPGGVTLVLESVGESGAHVAFVGDTLFAGSIGRSDFPTSDEAALHRSIRERLYTLDEDTTALPGHGPPTTIGREKRSNPFVRS